MSSEEYHSALRKLNNKQRQVVVFIVTNRPENGGTVPNLTTLSRYCPEIYKAKPKFN